MYIKKNREKTLFLNSLFSTSSGLCFWPESGLKVAGKVVLAKKIYGNLTETFHARPQTPSPTAARFQAVPNMPETFPGRPRVVSVPGTGDDTSMAFPCFRGSKVLGVF
ncbi:hypothetical protein HanRHA438_Chr15g0706951 [Helianthus annuus]|nr:hypothetical protein HanRHA438_Chr15g0706951 [Helianthus annuus]